MNENTYLLLNIIIGDFEKKRCVSRMKGSMST